MLHDELGAEIRVRACRMDLALFGEAIAVTDVRDQRLDDFRRGRIRGSASKTFLVEGADCVKELLRSSFVIEKAFLQASLLRDVRSRLEMRWSQCTGREDGGPILPSVLVGTAELLEEVSGLHALGRGNLAFALARRRPASLKESLTLAWERDRSVRVLALDGLTDASNVGAMFCVAAAFGISAVLCSADCCDPFQARAIRVSRGYAFHVPVIRGPLAQMLHELRERGTMVLGAIVQPGARFLTEVDALAPHWALVVGSEHFGVSEEVRQACNMLIKIPMAAGVDSLNAVVSAGVLVHGCVEREQRQRKLDGLNGRPTSDL